MIGFFIKKTFYSVWDNLFLILLLNTLVLVVGAGGYSLAALTVGILPLSVAILAIALLLEGILLVSASAAMAKVANYKSLGMKDLVAAVKAEWKFGILYAVVWGIFGVIVSVALPYYFRMGTLTGFALAMVLFWVAVVFVLAFQWFLPIRSQLGGGFLKTLKKCFLIFFDNTGFSLFMFFHTIVLLAISVVLVLLMPGFAWVILSQNEAFRLRMYKYDWLEKHPELEFKAARKSVPWGELIAEDYETVGHRSVRSFIFPWKD